MKKYVKMIFLGLLFVILLIGVAAATESLSVLYSAKDSISILPHDNILYEAPVEQSICNHNFIIHTNGEEMIYPMDDYFCCCVKVIIHSKMCSLCTEPGYDLHYEMIPHDDDTGICKNCGRVPFTPAVAIPLS